ncbi:MAG: DNA polymerase IV [Ignavibacteria bacterium]|nr:DNA polymerase IV [Ignavibacteria bacterium]
MNTAKNTGKISSSFFIPRDASRSAHLFKRIRMMPLYSFPHHKDLGNTTGANRNKYFIHLDLDAFYAQVEQRDNPKLRGRPVSVGGGEGNKGIVMTASYEARRYGVDIGMSVVDAKRLCPELISLPCYGTKYEAVLQSILYEISKLLPEDCIEQYSVDECFLDITPVAPDYFKAAKLAWQIKKLIRDKEDLTASIGLSFNKSYAKMATKFNKPDGLTIVREENRDMIYRLPVKKMWGIGHRMEIRMHSLGIRTIGELAESNFHAIHKEFGINGVILRKIARGEDTSGIASGDTPRVEKSFTHNHTLSTAIYESDKAEMEIKRMTEYVCRRMRAKDLIADHVGLSLRYEDLGYQGDKVRLCHATNSEKELFHNAMEIYRRLPQPGPLYKIRTFGIFVYDLFKVTAYNLDLFNRDHLIPYKQIDLLKDKYGENIIRMGLGNS